MTRRRPRWWLTTGTLALTLLTCGPQVSRSGILGTAPVYAQAASVGRGYDLLLSNQINAAIAVFEQLVRQSPNNVEALTGLGIAYRRAGRDADALETYQRVLAIDPDNRLALGTVGLLGEFRPEWQPLGIRALTRLLELDPDNLEARAQRAKLFYYQGLFPSPWPTMPWCCPARQIRPSLAQRRRPTPLAATMLRGWRCLIAIGRRGAR